MASMGIGTIGQPNIIIKRKNRWTMVINTPTGNIPAWPCKAVEKPSLEIEENEISFLNAVTWLPGRAKWQPITVSYHDVASSDLQPLYNWIHSVYSFQNTVNLQMTEKAGWNATAIITEYDGCGATLDYWTLGSVWPQSIKFGELDQSSGEFCSIDITLRYSEVNFNGTCGVSTPQSTCIGC